MAEDKKDILGPVDNVIGIDAPLEILEVPKNMTLVGAIELSGTNSILAIEKLQMAYDMKMMGLTELQVYCIGDTWTLVSLVGFVPNMFFYGD
jgi:hypothetical protein